MTVALWEGALWDAARTTCRGLMRLGVDELAHVCARGGGAFLGFEEAQDRWPLPVALRAQWRVLIAELEERGAAPVAGRLGLTPRGRH